MRGQSGEELWGDQWGGPTALSMTRAERVELCLP